MEFEQRLEKAVRRGQRRGEAAAREARAQQISEAERRRLHSQYRLELSERIEACLKRLPNYFPGFEIKTMYGERGWGAACSRDDVGLSESGRRTSFYSRLEMTIRPYSSVAVLELTAKGTIRNKELFTRTYYEHIDDVDIDKFSELIDLWVLEYAEQYAAAG